MTTGKYTGLFILGSRKTVANLDAKGNMELMVKINRVSGELKVLGYGIKSQIIHLLHLWV